MPVVARGKEMRQYAASLCDDFLCVHVLFCDRLTLRYYLARQQRAFSALSNLSVLDTLTSNYKEVEGGTIKSS